MLLLPLISSIPSFQNSSALPSTFPFSPQNSNFRVSLTLIASTLPSKWFFEPTFIRSDRYRTSSEILLLFETSSNAKSSFLGIKSPFFMHILCRTAYARPIALTVLSLPLPLHCLDFCCFRIFDATFLNQIVKQPNAPALSSFGLLCS